MIGSLRGMLASKAPPLLLVEAAGVGYELEAPMSTFYGLPAVGSEIRLLTHLVVREDAHVLYGFATDDERRLFRALLKVSGVGPKIALAILSGITVEDFSQFVASGDVASLTRIPGVGRKTAERLLVEMRDRLDGLAATAPAAGAIQRPGPEGEAFAALVALGYRPAEATRLLDAAAHEGATTEELIRRALQGAGR
ncbi:MAG: Holliday junction branch migration protein RuvA [Gammaproteobacteria bacterium]|nr:Holliday junction branch migration protein RuvA [Gammaproteobacteria bacterium]